jgi:hypothetical protein
MKFVKQGALFGGLLIIVAIGVQSCLDKSLKDLPHFSENDTELDYRVTPYIRTAMSLQQMGQKRACLDLMRLAKRNDDAEQIYVLCRMLFSQRPSAEFRPPGIGEPVFLGGSDWTNWPNQPIEIVNGVPFLVTWSYKIFGQIEPPADYLAYCMTNCNWNKLVFVLKNKEELHLALNTLTNSPKWKRPLTPHELEILQSQINE